MSGDLTCISVAIPTNGRPESLRNCINSLKATVSDDLPIYVLDSTPIGTEEGCIQMYDQVFDDFADVVRINYDQNVPPGRARKLLSQQIQTEFILFLDDDLIVMENAVQKMYESLVKHAYDIVSGVWLGAGGTRPIGFKYFESFDGDGDRTIYKLAVPYEVAGENELVQLDDVQASILVRSEALVKANFDERYDFLFELYDFFLECKKASLKVGAHTGAFFDHQPVPYQSLSTRHVEYDREVDKARFIKKWGMSPKLIL